MRPSGGVKFHPLDGGALAATLRGRTLLPGLVEPHAHLDKALTGDLVGNRDGTLPGAIDAWIPFRARLGAEGIRERARAAALRYLVHGATLIRTHSDTGPDIGLRAVEAVLAVRDELAGLIEIQVVACGADPISGASGAGNRALLRAALELGADLVGGAPWQAERPDDALETLLEIADAAGRGVDLHVDETTDRRVLTLPRLVQRVVAGFRRPVTASHCISLGSQPPGTRRRIAEEVAAAGVGIVTNPLTSLYLQRRQDRGAVSRGLTAIRELLDAGASVAAGGDNLRDPFNPLGSADPLETAALLVSAAHLSVPEALDAVSSAARRLPGMPPPTPASEGVAIAAASPAEALATRTPDRDVLRDARVIALTRVETTIAPIGGAEVTA
jgi:cytosine deaminase